jgi:hypothetical protein
MLFTRHKNDNNLQQVLADASEAINSCYECLQIGIEIRQREYYQKSMNCTEVTIVITGLRNKECFINYHWDLGPLNSRVIKNYTVKANNNSGQYKSVHGFYNSRDIADKLLEMLGNSKDWQIGRRTRSAFFGEKITIMPSMDSSQRYVAEYKAILQNAIGLWYEHLKNNDDVERWATAAFEKSDPLILFFNSREILIGEHASDERLCKKLVQFSASGYEDMCEFGQVEALAKIFLEHAHGSYSKSKNYPFAYSDSYIPPKGIGYIRHTESAAKDRTLKSW